MSRPVSLTIAVVLQWVAGIGALIVGLDLIASAFELSDPDTKASLEQAMVSTGVTDVGASLVVRGIFMAGAVVVGLALLRVILALYLARGRNWARLVIAILALVQLIIGVVYLFQEQIVFGSLAIALEVAVLWMLFNAKSSAFIRERSAS
ncbi:MAG: hypothetical protein IPO93_06365 [Actinobacteria bacterium]|jgi:hypothetical protein|nr:hypothetical protein [Actinomycetota bacterium]